MAEMKTIMIVDDSTTMRRMIQAALRDVRDVRFIEADNGLVAIERLSIAAVHLVTLDLNMPDMHGLDVLRFIRMQPTYRALPVIVLTTRGDAALRADMLAAGASLCLSKPFEPHMLAGHVCELLQPQ